MATRAAVDERDDSDARRSTGASAAAAPRRRRPAWRTAVGVLLAILAVGCAAALPFAPVRMSTPEITWPQVAGQPESTMLELTSQEPVTLDAGFSCATARVAAGTVDGVLLATVRPDSARAESEGLVVSARGGVLRVVSVGKVLLDEPLPEGDCRFQLHADGSGLSLERDGAEVGRASAGRLPGIDVLATSLPALSPAEGQDLAVRIGVDDQFSTSPTPLKTVLSILCLVGALGSLWWLWSERQTGATRSVRRQRRSAMTWVRRGLDAAVVAVLLLWTLVTPMTGDDGYYAAMARNSPLEGFVGNYYQLLNQSFTPFTWFYRLLGWWEEWTGAAPALLRVPALAAGLATYAMAARLVAIAPWPGQRPRTVAHALLGVTFLAWWLPFDMGVRPESMVALAGTGTLLAVLVALRRQSLGWAGVAVLVAAVGFVCHPTGFVVLAPLLAGLPGLIRLVRSGRATRTLARALCLIAPGAVAGVVAFSDGTLRDFLRGQQIFLAAQPQQGWIDEYQRYTMLLGPGFMGAYAKRLPVLITIVALGGWLVLAAALRARGRPLPTVLHLSAVSFGLSLLLLWLTPSKWSFHFGSLAGVGAVFLTLLLCGLPRLARQATPRRVLSAPVVIAAAGVGALAVALALVGPNSWPSSWMLGVPQADEPPSLLGIGIGRPAGWVLLLALVTGAVWWWTRRRARRVPDAGAAGPAGSWRAALTRALPLVLAAALVLDAAYLVGSFGYAAIRPQASWSPWGDTLRDPLAENCHASGAFQVLDDAGARPLAALPGAPAETPTEPPAFVEGSGWYGAVPPASTTGRIWGSLQAPALNAATGSFTTDWARLPQLGPDEQIALSAAGNLQVGDGLVAEYGRSGPTGVEVVGQQDLSDDVDAPYWRTLALNPRVSDGAGADVVRLVALDGTTQSGGWLAFSEPSVRRVVSVEQYLGGTEPVGVAWQIALLFPCQDQPRVHYGITEPVDFGVLYGASLPAALGDATWLVDRGGIYAPVLREASVTSLPTWLPGARRVKDVQVYRFEYPYPEHRYELSHRTTTASGWAAPPGWGDRPAR